MPEFIELSNKYEPLFDPELDHLWDTAIITGGRGSGKSFAVTLRNLQSTENPDHKILSLRYTMKSASDSIIPETEEKIELMEWTPFFKTVRSDIENLATGARILFRGVKTSSGNQTANLKSIPGLTILHVEEGEEFVDEDTFDTIELSVRSKKTRNKTLWVMNPTTKEHFIYKRFFESMGVPDNFNGIKDGVLFICTTYLDNLDNLSPKFIARAERMQKLNPTKYRHKMLGSWLDKAEGVIYTNWSIGELTESYDVTLWGCDIGLNPDPTALVEVRVDKKNKRFFVKEHLYETDMLTSDIHSALKNTAGKSLVWMDSAEPRLIRELNNLGSNVQAVIKGDGSVVEGIMLIKEWELVVDSESTNVIRELNNYAWVDKEGKSGVPRDLYNHALDALRYAVIAYLRGSGEYLVY